MKRGRPNLVLGPGTYSLSQPLVIPAGTKRFSLRGAGSDATVIRLNNHMSYAIEVGQEVLNHNNWGLTQLPQTPVLPSRTGDASLSLPTRTSVVPGPYVLYDQGKIEHRDGGATAFFRAEIVQVTTSKPNARRAILAQTIGREYSVGPALASVKGVLCEQVAVEGIGFDGAALDGSKAKGMLVVGLTRGVTLRDLVCRNFTHSGIKAVLCSDVAIKDVHVADAEADGPGEGYGIQVSRSRWVEIADCSTGNMRRGIVMHTGTTDALIERCTTDGTDFDTHGFDERRITFKKCTGGGISFGNEAWFAGGKNLVAEDCVVDEQVSIGPNVLGATLRRCVIGGRLEDRALDLVSTNHPQARLYGSGKPDQVDLIDCQLRATRTPIWLDSADDGFGRLRLTRCVIQGGGTCVRGDLLSGSLEMTLCRLVAGDGATPVTLQSPDRSGSIVMTQCTAQSGSATGVVVSGAFKGRGQFIRNHLQTTGTTTPRWLMAIPPSHVYETGNSASR